MQQVVQEVFQNEIIAQPFKCLYYSDPPQLKYMRDYFLRVIGYKPAGPYRMYWLTGPVNGIVIKEKGEITFRHTDGEPDKLIP